MTQPIPQPGQYPPAVPAPAVGEVRPDISVLFASVTGQISDIIRDEVELNKAKLRVFASKSGRGISLLAAATAFALYPLGRVFHTIEVTLKLVALVQAAPLIIVGIFPLIVLILAFVSVSSPKSVQAYRPSPTASVAVTREAIEKGLDK